MKISRKEESTGSHKLQGGMRDLAARVRAAPRFMKRAAFDGDALDVVVATVMMSVRGAAPSRAVPRFPLVVALQDFTGFSKQLATWQAFREATARVEYNMDLDLAHGSSQPRASRCDKK
ncbi:hypothetical protein CMUS01_06092 [Colletotrichum musicola]|uniref:Uncharacterized protein n=1 Tax=Colletotrichum musicola TaxID=2175873 RepID=A0A8H6NJ83_9PEZI|nr:hypothetical protein CMUS01_06092 [Colletotrichum musicola]